MNIYDEHRMDAAGLRTGAGHLFSGRPVGSEVKGWWVNQVSGGTHDFRGCCAQNTKLKYGCK